MNITPAKNKRCAAQRACGFTLLEVCLAFIVTFLAIAAILYVSLQVLNKMDTDTAIRNVNLIERNISKSYGTSSEATLTTRSVANAGLLPDNIEMHVVPIPLSSSQTRGVNVWGGDIIVSGTTNAYFIKYTQVPSDSCAQFVMSSAGHFISIRVGWMVVNKGGTLDERLYDGGEIDTDKVVSQCASRRGGSTVTFRATAY